MPIRSAILLGSGNVATHLGEVLLQKGIKILQVYSLHENHAQELAEKTGSEAISDITKINTSADIYIICVKDDAISEIDLVLRLPGKLVVHTSGSADLQTITHISEKTGVLYPLQTFTKNRNVHWPSIPICIEGSDGQTTQDLLEFAGLISPHVHEIETATRRKLHLAAVFANNFTNYLLSNAKEIVGDKIPFSLLKPLVLETVEKAFETDPAQVQTGPAARGDHKTIETHLALLQDNPAAKELYDVITKLLLQKYGQLPH